MTASRLHLPRVQPIVPLLRSEPFNDPGWTFEPKYDGFRGMLYLGPRECMLYSKRGNSMSRFRDLARSAAAGLRCSEAILDGEIVALDTEGRIDFWGLMRGRGALMYAAFDLLWLDGRDLRSLRLERRKQKLQLLIPKPSGPLSCVPSFPGDGRELLEAVCRLDLEGIVAKRSTDIYDAETAWYKIKNPTYTQAEGRRELFERHAHANSPAR